MKNLKILRVSKGLSLKELGDSIGVAESTVSLYESGKREPDYKTLSKLADFFDVSIDYLLGRQEKKLSKAEDNCLEPRLKNEQELFEIFNSLTDENQKFMLKIAKGFVSSEKSEDESSK